MIPTSVLDKEQTIAQPGFNRWLIPPAALAIHLCIGQVYGFSVFNLPMTKLIGISQSAPTDWNLPTLGWIFSSAIAFLGISAAFFGKWVEKEGPRKAMFVAALCFSGGFFISAFGVYLHQIVLVYLGYGVLGGIGLGIGYISPVSTLIKWFPDRPGMATGMAIMGFGGGAIIGSPLAVALMNHFKSSTSVGVWQTFVVMGAIYFCLMMCGVFLVRVAPTGWQPAGYTPSVQPKKLVTTANVNADNAIKTQQFWLLWVVLCTNVTAGIGVLSQASPMIQEMFKVSASVGAGFVVLLSLFNLVGRFFWSFLSDYIGRKRTYMIFFGLGMILYALIPTTGKIGNIFLFYIGFCIILTMYGGGFATIPAYLRDLFGTVQVGAIHGRLLTAWSVAGVLGPVLVNYIRESQINHGIPKAEAYTLTMYIMVGVLLIGFIANLLVREVHRKYSIG
ncbi:OFA family MFS transporter [uncultured Nostoc sp.]|uniref:L-lactate MFS transporter n=1 Tax=uncultured Nostoc sp. TaxID=340711 RepID=UPI002638634F|nr:OFA family MFS transporter [uncultured Nostoc sp.]